MYLKRPKIYSAKWPRQKQEIITICIDNRFNDKERNTAYLIGGCPRTGLLQNGRSSGRSAETPGILRLSQNFQF